MKSFKERLRGLETCVPTLTRGFSFAKRFREDVSHRCPLRSSISGDDLCLYSEHDQEPRPVVQLLPGRAPLAALLQLH
jgi:hypothetical protein